ncbi:MAG: hypothetical protein ACFE0Q_14805 [Anaerolineae bacterium]
MVTFYALNASDQAEGQRAYEALTLPGHPSIVIFNATQQEVYRGFGSFEAETLADELQNLLS